MGDSLIIFYKDKVKKSWKVAFFTTFIACLLIHLYKFSNTLPNHDSLFNVYADQDMTISGRWFLGLACGISSYFDLPWINGLLCAVYLGITAAVIAELFDLKNPVVIGLSGLLLAGCPSTTETLFFGFTADGYLLGLLLSALAANFSCKATSWYHYILSGVCICLSCAIYQAYVSFSVVLSICYLVNCILEKQGIPQNTLKWMLKHIFLYVISLAAYYVVWKAALAITGQSATDYRGINNVGKINASMLVGGAIDSVRNLLLLLLEWNILEHPISLYAILNVLFFIGLTYAILAAMIKSGVYKDCGATMMVLFSLVISVPIISIWSFLSTTVSYRPMMLHSVIVFYIFSLILFDRWVNPKLSTLFGIGMAVMIFNFAIMANISYFYLDKCYEKTYYMGSRIMERIEDMQQSDASITQVAFVGSRVYDVEVTSEFPGSRIHILSSKLEKDLLFDHSHAYLYLENTFGLNIPQLPENQINELAERSDVREMGKWPAKDAVRVIDGILTIKLGDS